VSVRVEVQVEVLQEALAVLQEALAAQPRTLRRMLD
jgi:hypothetical protein